MNFIDVFFFFFSNDCVNFLQFDRRNGSTRAIVIQDALQIANIVDLVSYIFDNSSEVRVVLFYFTNRTNICGGAFV